MNDTIQAQISEHYGIMPYGKVGMEILKDGKQVAKFCTHKASKKMSEHHARQLNWLEAVTYAQRNVQ